MCLDVTQKKGTYLVHYGRWIVFEIMLGTVGVGMAAGYLLGIHRLLMPIQLILIAVSLLCGVII